MMSQLIAYSLRHEHKQNFVVRESWAFVRENWTKTIKNGSREKSCEWILNLMLSSRDITKMYTANSQFLFLKSQMEELYLCKLKGWTRRGSEGGPDPAFPLLFHGSPASCTQIKDSIVNRIFTYSIRSDKVHPHPLGAWT